MKDNSVIELKCGNSKYIFFVHDLFSICKLDDYCTQLSFINGQSHQLEVNFEQIRSMLPDSHCMYQLSRKILVNKTLI